jgi:hypothetical protein
LLHEEQLISAWATAIITRITVNDEFHEMKWDKLTIPFSKRQTSTHFLYASTMIRLTELFVGTVMAMFKK